ncbi:Sec63 [Aspergillus nanangensis]|uniref:DNA 3'-5' helicase n=1 Tax=Aspergillus nanangensis TaxID=2582783 RepID=A0AAD4CG58_ASPNN|nr:Sec63 [Aspergillus nanangensis]
MLGRAGRPQFDDSAIAVILTRKERVNHYERLVAGSESLESCLHLNLIDHLNAEIGLGNVTDIDAAVRWLGGTFLFVRLRRNPTHYQLKEGAHKDDENEMLRQICEKDIKLLQECGLVSSKGLKSTQFGDAMARYYVRFNTMKTFLALKPQSTMSQILSVICQADEFHEVRLKPGDKSLYKEVNRANGIRFPVKVDIALPSHKISLLLQSELGAVEFPDGEQFQKHKFAFQQDKNLVFSHVNRLVRCIIDCQICLEDSIAVRNALELARSFAAKVWDSSPLQMKQIEQIGIVAVRKLAAAGVTNLDELEDKEAHEIDMILSKNPPFGMKLLDRLADFPKLRISVKMVGKDMKPGQPIRIRFKAEIAFMNEKCPSYFRRHPVYVCFLAETSDGRMIDFRRISGNKFQSGHEILLSTEIRSNDQFIACYGMCDDIAGTLRSVQLKPDLPASVFATRPDPGSGKIQKYAMNSGRPRSDSSQGKSNNGAKRDIFDSDDFLFDDFLDIEQATDWATLDKKNELSGKKGNTSCKKNADNTANGEEHDMIEEIETPRLENGKWACNHKCKDKTTCKHLCCREGLDKPPRSSKRQPTARGKNSQGLNQLTLSASMGIKNMGSNSPRSILPPEELSQPNQPANDIVLSSMPKYKYDLQRACSKDSSDYGNDSFSDLPSPSTLLLGTQIQSHSERENKNKESVMVDELFDMDDGLISIDESPHYLSTKKQGLSPISSPRRHVEMGSATPDAVLRTNKNDIQVVSGGEQCLVDVPKHGEKRRLPPLTFSSGEKRTKTEQKEGLFPTDKPTSNNDTIILKGQNDESGIATSSSLDPICKDWEDIDPALLNEFKDIVNFF